MHNEFEYIIKLGNEYIRKLGNEFKFHYRHKFETNF